MPGAYYGDDGYDEYGRERNFTSGTRCKAPVARYKRSGDKTRVTVASGNATDAEDQGLRRDYPLRYDDSHLYRSRNKTWRSRARDPSPDYSRQRSRSRSRGHRRHLAEAAVGGLAGERLRERRQRSRSRSRSRSERSRSRRRSREDDSDDAESANLYERDDYSMIDFDFSMTTTSSSGTLHDDESDVVVASADFSPSMGKPVQTGSVTELHVTGSNWIGTAFDGWGLKAELRSASGPPPPHASSNTSLRWHHMERALMNFAEFTTVCLKALHLPENDKRHVNEVIRKAQKEHEKQRQLGRDMDPTFIAEIDFKEVEAGEEKELSSISFFNFPFFRLEDSMANRNNLTAGSPEHPQRPLLQGHTRTVNEKRELAQAITTMRTTPKGHYLYTSSVWGLVVNDNTIITCSKLSLPELHGDVVETGQTKTESPTEQVQVKTSDGRSWHIPAETVRIWPSLPALFAEEATQISSADSWSQFRFRDKRVDHKNWPSLLSKANKGSIELVLEGKNTTMDGLLPGIFEEARTMLLSPQATGDAPADPTKPSISPKDQGASIETAKSLIVFYLGCNRDEKKLLRLADALHEALSDNALGAVRKMYLRTGESTQLETQASIRQASETVKAEQPRQKRQQAVSQYKERIAVLAMHIFGFFWPLNFEHVMARKFFGAVQKLLEGEHFFGQGHVNPSRDAENAQELYRRLYENLLSTTTTFTSTFGTNEKDLANLPDAFHKAWLHFMMSFIIIAEAPIKESYGSLWGAPLKQLMSVGDELDNGQRILTSRLRKANIEDYEVCPARGIVALVLDRLSRDIMGGKPDVAQTYSDYFKQLEAKVVEDPLLRSHQETIRALQQELEAVLSTLTSQLEVVNVFERSIQEQCNSRALPRLPALEDSRQDFVIRQNKAFLNSRIDQFKALQGRATELGEWHLGQIDTNKDRQEAAIMVFTIVTVIFLPLSFVAGLLGMNTADIRDMNLNQWVYWASALPLTILVVGGSLYFAGALDNIRLGTGGSRATSNTVQPVQEAYLSTTAAMPEPRIRTRSRGHPAYPSRRAPEVYNYPRRRTTYPVINVYDADARDGFIHY